MSNPSGLCKCGCGQKTAIARQTRSELGHVKGQPVSYISGHAYAGRNFKDLAGQKFGRLVVIKEAGRYQRQITWLCACACGKQITVRGAALRNGNTESCGCLQQDRTSAANLTHGHRHSRLYRIWSSMKSRCHNPNDNAYLNYGGRGIAVCEEWRESFEAFLRWAISNSYAGDLTIDRIDNDGNYEPTNCRWITRAENTRKGGRVVAV